MGRVALDDGASLANLGLKSSLGLGAVDDLARKQRARAIAVGMLCVVPFGPLREAFKLLDRVEIEVVHTYSPLDV